MAPEIRRIFERAPPQHNEGETRQKEGSFSVGFIFAASALIVAFSLTPLLFNPRFYFKDDAQTYYFPLFIEVARLIKQGYLPFISPHTWEAGNLMGEYQTGLFNPFLVAAYLILDTLRLSFVRSATLLIVVFHWFNSLAILALGKTMGLPRRLSLAVALTVQSGAFYLYFYSATWIPGVLTFGFMVWSLKFSIDSLENPRFFSSSFFGVLVFSYALFTGGHIQPIYVFSVFLVFVLLFYRSRSLPLFFSLLLAAAIALPSLIPVWELAQESARKGWVDFAPVFKSDLNRLILSGLPVRSLHLDGRQILTRATNYLGWYLPLFMSYLFLGEQAKGKTAKEKTFSAMALFCLFQTCLPLPGAMGISSRLLPSLALFGAMATIPALYHNTINPFRDTRRLRVVGILTILCFLYYNISDLNAELLPLGFAAVVFSLFWRVEWSSRNGQNWFLAAIFGFFLIQTHLQRENNLVSEHFVGGEVPQPTSTPRAKEWSLFIFENSPFLSPGTPYSIGNGILFMNRRWINGYSPISLRNSLLNRYYDGRVSPHMLDESLVPTFGERPLDLLGVGEILVDKRLYEKTRVLLPANEWTARDKGAWVELSKRKEPCHPSSSVLCVTYASPQIQVVDSWDRHTTYGAEILNSGNKGSVVIAKPWYPGMRVLLNDKEVGYRTLHRMLAVVTIPANFHGALKVSYFSNKFIVAAYVSLCCLFLAIVIPLLKLAVRQVPSLAIKFPTYRLIPKFIQK